MNTSLLGRGEALKVLQPIDILALLLGAGVRQDEIGQIAVDLALLEVVQEGLLQIIFEFTELGTIVELALFCGICVNREDANTVHIKLLATDSIDLHLCGTLGDFHAEIDSNIGCLIIGALLLVLAEVHAIIIDALNVEEDLDLLITVGAAQDDLTIARLLRDGERLLDDLLHILVLDVILLVSLLVVNLRAEKVGERRAADGSHAIGSNLHSHRSSDCNASRHLRQSRSSLGKALKNDLGSTGEHDDEVSKQVSL